MVMISIDMDRPLCTKCHVKPAAVNYHKDNKVYYRSLCEHCLDPGKRKPVAAWRKSGYKLKLVCDMCGFKAIDKKQMTVFYIDGDLRNNNWPNLKSVCANCAVEISVRGLDWKEDDVRPDF